jgi:tetratricopeptide (TPR) repeat protein
MSSFKGVPPERESFLPGVRRQAAHRGPSRGTWYAPWRLVILLSPWLCPLVGLFHPMAPAGATTKSRGLPTHQAPARKDPPAPERSYEKRLQQALELTQHQKWHQAIRRIGTLDPVAPMTPTVGRLWFLRARLAQHLQDAPTAVQAFTQVWRTYSPLADYAAWELTQYGAAQDRLPAPQETVTALAAQYPFSRLVPDGQLLLAQTQHRLARVPQAQTTLERLIETYADDPARPEAIAFLGQIYEETGDWRRAFQTFQHFGESFPRHPPRHVCRNPRRSCHGPVASTGLCRRHRVTPRAPGAASTAGQQGVQRGACRRHPKLHLPALRLGLRLDILRAAGYVVQRR